MVERPAHSFKKRTGKLLVYPDGRNRCAQIGLVDDCGVSLYMLDTGNTEHFEFTDYNELLREAHEEVQKAQHEASTAIMERDAIDHDLERAILLGYRALKASDGALNDGKYPRGVKSKYKDTYCHIKSNLKSIEARWFDGQLSDGR